MMKRRNLLIILLTLLLTKASTQEHGGIEQFYYATSTQGAGLVPKIYYQSSKNWYAEARYNYEDAATCSVVAGKVFSNENILNCSITPLAGLAAGRFNGVLLGLKTEINYKKISFLTESQYSYSVKNRDNSFFYSWIDAGYQITDAIYAGAAMQLNIAAETMVEVQPGILIEFAFKKWAFPVYLFNPSSKNRYAVVGISYELDSIINKNRSSK